MTRLCRATLSRANGAKAPMHGRPRGRARVEAGAVAALAGGRPGGDDWGGRRHRGGGGDGSAGPHRAGAAAGVKAGIVGGHGGGAREEQPQGEREATRESHGCERESSGGRRA